MLVRRVLSLSLVLLLLTLAGCSGGSKSAGTQPQKAKTPSTGVTVPTTPAPKQEAPTLTVKVGSTEKAALKNLPMLLTGFAEQEALKVEYVEYKGGSEVSKALLSGEIDMAFTTVDSVMTDKSGEFRVLAMVTNGPGQALLVDSQYKDSIKSVKDLAGKAIGVSTIGSGPHKTLQQLLATNNIDAKSVQVLPVGLDPEGVLGTGKVAAMMTIEPFITLGVKSGKGFILVDARKGEGIQAIYGTSEVPWISLITTNGYIEKNADAVQRMVNEVSKSLKFIAGNSSAAISGKTPSFFKDAVKGDEAVFAALLDENKATFSRDGSFNSTAMAAVWKRLQDAGSVPKDKAFSMDQYVVTKFLQNVK